MEELICLIKNTKRYYISNKGYCYKESKYGFKKTIISLNIIRGIPKVKIENKKLNLPLLLIEYFYKENLTDNFTYTWKVIDNRVPFSKVNVINRLAESNDDKLIIQYKCDVKSNSANARTSHKQKITSKGVLDVLKRNDFKCFYCDSKLKSKTWQLDHVFPISKGGHNTLINLTASCKECNQMKGSMNLDKFYHQVGLISENIKNKSK